MLRTIKIFKAEDCLGRARPASLYSAERESQGSSAPSSAPAEASPQVRPTWMFPCPLDRLQSVLP